MISLPKTKKEDAFDKIQGIAKGQLVGRVEILDHARGRMLEREITDRQVLNVLRNGTQVEQPEWSSKDENGWKCKISRVTAGAKVTVIAKLVERKEDVCLVVTLWS